MEFDERTFWTFVLVIAAALAYTYMPRWRSGSPFLPPSDLKSRLDAGEDVVVADVRTPGEYGRAHIPDAVNVPVGDLAARLRRHDRDLDALRGHPVFVHCTGELRAAKAARLLRKAGFTDVSVLKGGIRGWKRAGFPLQKEHPKSAA